MTDLQRANALRAAKRFGEAADAYGAILARQPDHLEARVHRGFTLLELGRNAEALEDFRRVDAQAPGQVPVLLGMAIALRYTGQAGEALSVVARVLGAAPRLPGALLLKNDVLRSLGRFDEAREVIEGLLADHPDMAEAHVSRAFTCLHLKRYDDALEACERASQLASGNAGARVARCLALGELGRLDEQKAALREAEQAPSRNADYDYSLGQAYETRGDLADAEAAYRRAIATDPQHWRAHRNLGLVLMAQGAFSQAWPEHEWRLKDGEHPAARFARHAPVWQGEALDGKHLLVHPEQGAGDSIQFLRFVDAARARAARVTLVMPRSLRRLAADNLANVEVTDKPGAVAKADFQTSLMSLPAHLDATLANIGGTIPYLAPNEDAARQWAERIGDDGYRVGIVWQGNPAFRGDHRRSVPLRHFAPLGREPDVRLISLQAVHGLDQLAGLPDGMTVEQLGPDITDNPDGLSEIAAVMAHLDLIVTSDTAVAHLAGAMGRPVWLALADRPDWRWLRERTDSPWYPTMRLFRQARRGDWDEVFARIAAALQEERRAR